MSDSDMLKSEFMGKVNIPLTALANRSECREWYEQRSGQRSGGASALEKEKSGCAAK